MTKEEGPLDFLEKKATIICGQLNSDLISQQLPSGYYNLFQHINHITTNMQVQKVGSYLFAHEIRTLRNSSDPALCPLNHSSPPFACPKDDSQF